MPSYHYRGTGQDAYDGSDLFESLKAPGIPPSIIREVGNTVRRTLVKYHYDDYSQLHVKIFNEFIKNHFEGLTVTSQKIKSYNWAGWVIEKAYPEEAARVRAATEQRLFTKHDIIRIAPSYTQLNRFSKEVEAYLHTLLDNYVREKINVG